MDMLFSILILISGVVIFCSSLLYGRAVMRNSKRLDEVETLTIRARHAATLPSEESQAEFAAIMAAFDALAVRNRSKRHSKGTPSSIPARQP